MPVESAVDLEPTDAVDYSTHSLRRGFVTAARRNKQDLEHIRRVTGHASLEQLVDYEHIDEVFAREVEVGLGQDGME